MHSLGSWYNNFI